MKVYIRDKRSTPRIIYIDGKKFYLGSKKEYLKDISPNALHALSQKEYLEIRPFEEENHENCDMKEEVKEAPSPKADVVEAKPEVISELKKEEIKNEPEIVDEVKEPVVEEMVEEKEPEQEVEEEADDKPNYASMTKKVLKGIIEEKGGDPSGMSKSNMVDWLNANG